MISHLGTFLVICFEFIEENIAMNSRISILGNGYYCLKLTFFSGFTYNGSFLEKMNHCQLAVQAEISECSKASLCVFLNDCFLKI
ncbi:hypothetical protein VAE122_940011 [Vibrio aestuarianus]|nr:hypothetical protein VAE122_940011 [Vibrio aestuarianus]